MPTGTAKCWPRALCSSAPLLARSWKTKVTGATLAGSCSFHAFPGVSLLLRPPVRLSGSLPCRSASFGTCHLTNDVRHKPLHGLGFSEVLGLKMLRTGHHNCAPYDLCVARVLGQLHRNAESVCSLAHCDHHLSRHGVVSAAYMADHACKQVRMPAGAGASSICSAPAPGLHLHQGLCRWQAALLQGTQVQPLRWTPP